MQYAQYIVEASRDGVTWQPRTAPLTLCEATRVKDALETDQRRMKHVNLEHRIEKRPEIEREEYRLTIMEAHNGMDSDSISPDVERVSD